MCCAERPSAAECLPGLLPERDPETREKLAYLRDPCHWPGHPAVQVIETHFAWVFLAGGFAYKLKKPMRQMRMDYRSLASRERGCRAEVALNRRLAPAVYLGVVPLMRTVRGTLALARGVQTVDWLVKMRRLPANAMLDRVIDRGSVPAAQRERIVRRLVRFFGSAAPRPMSERAYLGHLKRRTASNIRELLSPDLRQSVARVRELSETQLAFLTRCGNLIAGRGQRLIDGHGDLRAEHVYLGCASGQTYERAPCVIDCLEFDSRLRRLDPVEEMSQLALECARLGDSSLAWDLIARYERCMRDEVPEPVAYFYLSQRAANRAMVAAWHLRDAEYVHAADEFRARADSYLRDALRYARAALRLATRYRDAARKHPGRSEKSFGSFRIRTTRSG